MKLSNRHDPVTLAKLEVSQVVCHAVEVYGLTYAELVSILSAEILSWTRFHVRDERGEPEKGKSEGKPDANSAGRVTSPENRTERFGSLIYHV